jgi:DNA-binding transcriptional MerR regulator
VVIKRPGVSGRQLELRRGKDGWYPRALGEASKTRRNGKSVHPTALRVGEVLTFADVRIEVLSLESLSTPYAGSFRSPPVLPERRPSFWKSIKEAPHWPVLVIAVITIMPAVLPVALTAIDNSRYDASPVPREAHTRPSGDDQRLLFSQADRSPAVEYSEAELEMLELIADLRYAAFPVHERLSMLDDLRPHTERGVRYALDRASLALRRELSDHIITRWNDIRTGADPDTLAAFAEELETSIYHRQIANAIGITEDLTTMLLPRDGG